MDVSPILGEIEKLCIYNSAVDNKVSAEEFADTIEGYWSLSIEKKLETLSTDDQELIYRYIDDSLGRTITGKLEMFFLTVLLYHYMDRKYSDLLCKKAMDMGAEASCFTVQQLDSFEFRYPNVIDKDLLEKVYLFVLDIWKEVARDLCESIEVGDKDNYLLITSHFIGVRHAPSKTLIERVETLQNQMNKNVFVVHSKETVSVDPSYPFYNIMSGNYNERLNGNTDIGFDENFSMRMYQTPNAMPNLQDMAEAIALIKQFKPGRIIIMGEHCILSDILADYIPSILISYGFSVLRPVYNQYACLFRSMTDDDLRTLDRWECDPNKYICGTFTFKFIDQTSTISREELAIPQDAFVLTTIGNRLGTDLTDDFLDMLAKLKGNWHYALAGNMKEEEYETICSKHPFMKERSTFVGYQKDILAFLDNCDLYVNPPRLGGGFSIAEAFQKGKPGVSINYGDVAAAAGDDFLVDSLDEMKLAIEKYITDSDFYREMSDKAVKRAVVLTDGKAALADIIDEFERRIM